MWVPTSLCFISGKLCNYYFIQGITIYLKLWAQTYDSEFLLNIFLYAMNKWDLADMSIIVSPHSLNNLSKHFEH